MKEQAILFGAGQIGATYMQKLGYDRVYCFADNNRTGSFYGKKIISFNELKGLAESYDVIITAGDVKAEQEIAKQLNEAGIEFFTRFNYNDCEALENEDLLSIEREGVFTLSFAEHVKRHKPNVFALVGAASGGYARIAGRYMNDNSQMYIFEPMPQFYRVLFDYFGNDKRTHIIRKAVSNNNDKIDLHAVIKSSDFDICHSYTIDSNQSMFGNEFEDDDVRLTATVSTVALDDFFKDTNVDLMLMDIEGAEVYAVEGMEKLIAKRKTTFFMEVHEPYVKALREDGMDYMTSVFKKHGYFFYWCELTENGDYKAERGGIRVVSAEELKWEHCIISPVPIDEADMKSWKLPPSPEVTI